MFFVEVITISYLRSMRCRLSKTFSICRLVVNATNSRGLISIYIVRLLKVALSFCPRLIGEGTNCLIRYKFYFPQDEMIHFYGVTLNSS